MSSIWKILVDIQCLVYCDFEEVGEAIPDSIFRLHILCNNNEDNSLLWKRILKQFLILEATNTATKMVSSHSMTIELVILQKEITILVVCKV